MWPGFGQLTLYTTSFSRKTSVQLSRVRSEMCTLQFVCVTLGTQINCTHTHVMKTDRAALWLSSFHSRHCRIFQYVRRWRSAAVAVRECPPASPVTGCPPRRQRPTDADTVVQTQTPSLLYTFVVSDQWSFRKTGTNRNGGEASENWCLGPSIGALAEVWGITPEKLFEIFICKILQFSWFYPENGSQCRSQCVLKHSNNGNAVPVRSVIFSTTRTAFAHVPFEITPATNSYSDLVFSRSSASAHAKLKPHFLSVLFFYFVVKKFF